MCGAGGAGGGGRENIFEKKNQKFLRWKWILWPVSVSVSAAEHITPGVFSVGNTVMWILPTPFIMYERKCYKLAAVKTSMSHLYLWGAALLLPTWHSEMLNNGIHEYFPGRKAGKEEKLQPCSSARCNFIKLFELIQSILLKLKQEVQHLDTAVWLSNYQNILWILWIPMALSSLSAV